MLKVLGSVKLTIVLFIILAAASIVGTLIPQTWADQQYQEKYGDVRYSILKGLQLTDIFHSYWFSALLVALCINLCVCSFQSFGPLMRSLKRSVSTAGRVEISSLPFYEKIRLSDGVESDQVIQKIKHTLSRSFYRVKYTDEEKGLYYFERGKIGRLGPLITHASVMIILIGGVLVATLGFKSYMNIPVGSTVDVPKADFQIRADDFKVEFYPDRTPKEYTSVLTVIDGGVEMFTKTIEVNSPLKYKGIKFYQSSYGQMDSDIHIIEVELSKKAPGEPEAPDKLETTDGSPHGFAASEKPKMEVLGRFMVDIHDPFPVPDSQLTIKVARFFPDYSRDAEGNESSKSNNPNNPAAFLELYEGDEPEPKYRAWSFLKFPDFHGISESDYYLKFVDIDLAGGSGQRYYTGLQIGYHPGLPVIWVGCLTMVAGMFIAFYSSFKRIWVRVSNGNVEIGGRSYKDRTGFEKEFNRLKNILG